MKKKLGKSVSGGIVWLMIALFLSHNLYPLGRVYAQEMGEEDEVPFRVEKMIAVLDLEMEVGVDKALTTPLTNTMISKLVGLKVYDVIDRANRDAILSEQGFQLKDCVDEECRVQAGRLLGVGKIVVGNISKIGEVYYINVQLINVETAMVEKSALDKCVGTIDALFEAIENAALDIAGIPRKPGILIINSTPPSAVVYIDGEKVGQTTLRTEVKPGKRKVMVTARGYKLGEQMVTVQPGLTTSMEFTLKKEPRKWYTSWWFLSLLGAAAASGVTAVALSVGGEEGDGGEEPTGKLIIDTDPP